MDIVVHSGDFLPNQSRGVRAIEHAYQCEWIRRNKDALRSWVGDRKLLVCSGNHDYVDVAQELSRIGIDATSLDDRLVDVDGMSFFGFPWVPWFTGEWNYEVSDSRIAFLARDLAELMNHGAVDVLVSHGPMGHVLDVNRYGEHCGSMAMRALVDSARHPPVAMLHGHIHESFGQATHGDTIVSNAAMGWQVVEV